MAENNKNWYDRIHKKVLILPMIVLILSMVYLYSFNSSNGDIIHKDVSLTGGTSITLFDENIDVDKIKNDLKDSLPDMMIRGISDIRTGKQTGIILETIEEPEKVKKILEEEIGYELNEDNSSIEFSGATLSQGFYKQLRTAIIFAFILMSIVIFLVFRSTVPSLAVIISAFADITMTLAVVDLIGLKISSAGVIAFLMLIGYSVDTDVLLTTRILRDKRGTVNERLYGAFKTGITMTLTSIAAVGVSLVIIYSFSEILRQIFIVLLIGLGFDIFNTWTTNSSIIKMYAEAKKI